MKLKGIKSIIAVSAVSAGVLFAGAQSANASTKVTVKSGDTLSQIAKTNDVSVSSLQAANDIKNIDLIFPGETFVIGGNGQVKVAPASVKAAPAAVKAPIASAPQQNQNNETTAPAAKTVQAPQKATTQTNTPAQTPAPTTNNSVAYSDDGSLDSIGAVESGNNYNARNGQYIGKYQLSASYLHGDFSPANQEATARQYAISRYGSIANAVAFRNAHNYW